MINLSDATAIRTWLTHHGKKIVFSNGCFDIIHRGHVEYLKKASLLGDCLIIGINDDNSVRRLKGDKRPIISLEDRAYILESLEFVNYVIAFSEDTPQKLIEQIQPDILVKGADYKIDEIIGADFVIRNGGHVETIELVKGKSTTDIIKIISEL